MQKYSDCTMYGWILSSKHMKNTFACVQYESFWKSLYNYIHLYLYVYTQSETISKSSSSVLTVRPIVCARSDDAKARFLASLKVMVNNGHHHCCIRIYKPPVDWNSLPILIVSCIIMYYQILIGQTNLTKSNIQITWASNYLTSIQNTKWSKFTRLTGVLEDVGMIGVILSFLMQKLTKKFILTSIEVDHWTWTESKLVPAPSNVWSKNPKGLLNGTPYHQFQV